MDTNRDSGRLSTVKEAFDRLFEKTRLRRYGEIVGRSLLVLMGLLVIFWLVAVLTKAIGAHLPELRTGDPGFHLGIGILGTLIAIAWMHINEVWNDLERLGGKIRSGSWRGPRFRDVRSIIMSVVFTVLMIHAGLTLWRAQPDDRVDVVDAVMELQQPVAASPPTPLISVPILFGQARDCDPDCEEGVVPDPAQSAYLDSLAEVLAACSADGDDGRVIASVYGFADSRRFALANEQRNLSAANDRRNVVSKRLRDEFEEWPERLHLFGGEWSRFEAMAANRPIEDANGGDEGQLNRSAIVTVWSAGRCSPGKPQVPLEMKVEKFSYVAHLKKGQLEGSTVSPFVTVERPANSDPTAAPSGVQAAQH